MGLETLTEVQALQRVQDAAGNIVAPATEQMQKAIAAAVGNPEGATVQTYTTGGTTPEQLPDLTIPDGVTAAIVYLPGNAGDVYLGDSNAQFVPLTDVGHSFTWEADSTGDLHIKTTQAGDGVGIIFEGAQ